MRSTLILSSALFAATVAFSAGSHAATITTLNNPNTTSVTVSGFTYLPTNYSHCANLSAARVINGYRYCARAVGTLSASQVTAINKMTFVDNPTTHWVRFDGINYFPSDYSVCAKFTQATLRNGFYWCRSTIGRLSTTLVNSVASISSPTPAPTPESAPAPAPTPTWNRVAYEGQSFSLSGSQTVRYGVGSSWIQRTLSGTQTCSNATFGNDPAYGTGKICQVMSSGSSPTSPAPAPAPASYTAQLSWTPPSTRADGSPLAMSELAGYEIYYTSDDLGQQGVTVSVTGGSNTSRAINSLQAGTYHFAISAIDNRGMKSALSTMASRRFGQ